MQDRRGSLIAGLVFILLGAAFLAQKFDSTLFGDWMFPIGLGVIFLVAYLLGRQYGFLIPGCILTSLGIGVGLIETNTVPGGDSVEGGVVVLALGLGFVAIWLIDLLVTRARGRWWPLIPGTILSVIGVLLATGKEAWLENVDQWWPVIFIVIGVWILLDRFTRRSS